MSIVPALLVLGLLVYQNHQREHEEEKHTPPPTPKFVAQITCDICGKDINLSTDLKNLLYLGETEEEQQKKVDASLNIALQAHKHDHHS